MFSAAQGCPAVFSHALSLHVHEMEQEPEAFCCINSQKSIFIESRACHVLQAAAGTWFKWVEGEAFSEQGLGGKDIPLANINKFPGGNPSVHWNTLLQRWVMVWASWEGKVCISSSVKATEWEEPKELIDSVHNSRIMYPTIISGKGDLVAGICHPCMSFWHPLSDLDCSS